MAGGVDRLVELVACVFDPKAPPSLSRYRSRPRSLQCAAGGGLRSMAGTAVERDRGQRPTGGPKLDVPDGWDEGTRAAAVRNVLCRKLDLQLQQMLRRLRAVMPGESCLICRERIWHRS